MTTAALHSQLAWKDSQLAWRESQPARERPRPAQSVPVRPLPQVAAPHTCPLGSRRSRLLCGLLVLLAHLGAAWALWHQAPIEVPVTPPGVVAVRWVAAPAPVVAAPQTPPAPQLAPTPPQPESKPEPKPKPKPVVKPKPTAKPVARPKPVPPAHQATPAAPQAAPQAAATAPVASAPAQGQTQKQGQPGPTQSSPQFNAAYLNNPAPAYPPLSRRFREEGKVMLRVRVSAEGQPLAVELAQSSGHPRLDEAARKTVLGWRFVPARRGEQKVAAWVRVPIVFQLRS
ncbi:TonB family protein [Pseudaeromonas sp. ZJS20]|uniref:energy transducer TonB n=1 Tax=Pseudaeromonas aegiceratis TaxID=3153928 RepID=UPI00390C74B8